MSGFEIAGIVLGVFPVVVEAFKPLRSRCKDWYRFKTKFTAFVSELSEQEMHFQETMSRLLQICFPDGEITCSQITSDKAGTIWIQHATEFRQHLGSHRLRFLQHLMAMRAAVDQLQIMLGVDDEGKVSVSNEIDDLLNLKMIIEKPAIDWLDNPDISTKYLRKRLIFCCSTRGGEILLALKEHNSKLRSIVEWSIGTLPVIQQMERINVGAYHDNIRGLCSSSFAALQTPWQCSCSYNHQAEVFVGLIPIDTSSTDSKLQLKLDLASGDVYPVTMSKLNAAPSTPTVAIHSGDECYFQADKLQTIQQQALAAPTLTQRTKSSLKATGKASNVTGSTAVPLIVVKPKTKHAKFNLPSQISRATQQSKIFDLCTTLRNNSVSSNITNLCYGSVSDSQDSHDFLLHAMPSLPDLERTVASVIEAPDFNIKERVVLAVSLVSALLQSYSTGWDTSTLWRKDDIKFYGRGPNTRIMLSSPFKPLGSPSHNQPPPSPQRRILTEDQTYELMSQFGVLLLEILYGKSIETLRGTMSQFATLTDVGVAKTAPDWSDVEGRLGEKVMSAIKCCLWTNFSGTSPNLDKTHFRRTVHDVVIAKLQEFYSLMWPEPKVP